MTSILKWENFAHFKFANRMQLLPYLLAAFDGLGLPSWSPSLPIQQTKHQHHALHVSAGSASNSGSASGCNVT
jgi:hypothetical protein